MPRIITESEIEQAVLDILSELGYKIIYGPDIAPAPEGISPERQKYDDVVLIERLKNAIDKFNPRIPQEAKEQALKQELDAVRLDAETQKATVVAAYLKHEDDVKAKTMALDGRLADLKNAIAKAESTILSLAQEHEKVETMLAQARKKYEAYKASLV